MCKQWQREILGEAFMEFYVEETGLNWFIFLKRIPIEFVNATDENVNTYVGLELVKDGEIAN